MIEIQVGTNDLANVGFAPDVVWETTASLNAIAFPREHLLHGRLRHLVPHRPNFNFDHLRTLTSNRSWVPDVLCPPPTGSSVDAEQRLADLRHTDHDVARADLRTLRRLHPGSAAATMSPTEYLDTTATAMTEYWRQVLRPMWDRVEAIVTADIAHHSARLAAEGLAATLPDVHDELSFVGESVRIAMRTETSVRASGRGVWFVPSVFRWPWLAVDVREYEPVISYAARGAGRVWEECKRSSLGLVDLLGRSRAEILQRLNVARTTTGLAREFKLSPSTVSWHLSVMTASGLLIQRRDGRRVLYARTAVGDMLVNGESGLAAIS